MTDLFNTGSENITARKTLRPHQQTAIDQLRESLGRGNRRVVIQAPTGFGKTLLAQRIMEGALGKDNKALFTVPMISLVGQTIEAFEGEGIEPSKIGVIQATHPRTDERAPLQIASVQSLAKRGVPASAIVVVDEAHIRSKVIEKIAADRPDLFMVGLSATPWAKGMGLLWQDLVIPSTIQTLIDQGYLSQFKVFAPDNPDMAGVRTNNGDYAVGETADVMSSKEITASVVETWLEKGEDRPTLLFGVNRAHAKHLSEAFERAGVSTAYCDAFTDRVERQFIEQRFRAGEVKIACSVRTLTTGVDWPVSCIIDAAPTKSEMLHVQKSGRGLRVNPGTEDLLVLDHAGNNLRLGLFTDIYHARLDDTEPGERAESVETPALPKPCPECGTLFTGSLCGSCGYQRTGGSGGVTVVDGSLVEITEQRRAEVAQLRAEKQRFYSMALALADSRGKPKLALGLFKGKFGEWPRALSEVREPPDRAFMSYEKSRRIAYAKMMEKKRGNAG